MLSVVERVEILKEAGYQDKIQVINDNKEIEKVEPGVATFKSTVSKYGWVKRKLAQSVKHFRTTELCWSKDITKFTQRELNKNRAEVRKCHNLARVPIDDRSSTDTNFSITIHGKITNKGAGSIAREMIGEKHLKDFLKDKYKEKPEDFYTKE